MLDIDVYPTIVFVENHLRDKPGTGDSEELGKKGGLLHSDINGPPSDWVFEANPAGGLLRDVRGSLRRPPALPGSSLQAFKADLRRRDPIYHMLWLPTQNSDAATLFLQFWSLARVS